MTNDWLTVPGYHPDPARPAGTRCVIGAAQDTIIGMANSAPTVAIGLSLAGLAAAAAYGSAVIILCGIPMLVIANAYRLLNLWSANCGASFEWVGRAIDPYLGFLTGWLMIAASLIAAVAGVVVLAPSVLAIFGGTALSTWPTSSSAPPSSWSCWRSRWPESASPPAPRSPWA